MQNQASTSQMQPDDHNWEVMRTTNSSLNTARTWIVPIGWILVGIVVGKCVYVNVKKEEEKAEGE